MPPLLAPCGRRAGTESGLLQAEFGEGGGAATETDRDALVIGNHRQAVFPAHITHALHLVRLTAEVDFAVDDSPPVEVRTKSRAVRAPVGGKDDDGVERDQLTNPPIAD